MICLVGGFISWSWSSNRTCKSVKVTFLYEIRPSVHLSQCRLLKLTTALQCFKLRNLKSPSTWEPFAGDAKVKHPGSFCLQAPEVHVITLYTSSIQPLQNPSTLIWRFTLLRCSSTLCLIASQMAVSANVAWPRNKKIRCPVGTSQGSLQSSILYVTVASLMLLGSLNTNYEENTHTHLPLLA